jgi:ATP-dependent DNA helicase RecQ
VLNAVSEGEVKVLYVAPERFASPAFREVIKSVKVGLFVVDEAHCVSQWGHDFRPDYFRLGDAARWLEAETLMAVTATATPIVASEIITRLGLREPKRIVTGFDRPNLSFGVVQCAGKEQVEKAIIMALSEADALPAIVYTGTRSRSERLAESLTEALGVPVINYHAGLNTTARAEAQRKFMEGEVPVVVATNAFGMGVDKADVRTVCHDGTPGSLEAYYQEAGRAGRDRKPSKCLLFTCGRDKGLHVFFIERSEVKPAAVDRIAERLIEVAAATGNYAAGVGELAEVGGCDEELIRSIAGHLIHGGLIKPTPSPSDQLAGQVIGEWDKKAQLLANQSGSAATRVRWQQYRAVWKWVEGGRCRRLVMLNHFGDRTSTAPEVACCDVCNPELTERFEEVARQKKRATKRGSQGTSRDGESRSKGGGSNRTGSSGGGSSKEALTDSERQDIQSAVLNLVAVASPAVGRTRAVEILRGSRSKEIVKNSYDGLACYGNYSHFGRTEVLECVDELLAKGSLASTGGRFPKLKSGTDSQDPREEFQIDTAVGESASTGEVAGSQNLGEAPTPNPEFRVAVLVSGEGTNLQAILDRLHGNEGVRVVAVGSDNYEARGLDRAKAAGVPTQVFALDQYTDRQERDRALATWLSDEQEVDLVVLAGYMQLLSADFLASFPNRVINVHPSLLPAFPGTLAIEQALAYGVKVFGVTVHFVDEGVDTGPIILQQAIEIPHPQGREHVLELLRPLEHEMLCNTIRLIAQDRVRFDPGNPRRVLVD